MQTAPKILIVDDEPRMCESLRLLLGKQGYDIQTATSGNEALGLISHESFDLALLDLVMPDMDGHQLMDQINSKFPDTIVIVITGHASLDSAVWALRRGAYDYLRKPFEYEELIKRVQNAIHQKQLTSEKALINGKLELSEKRYRYLVHNSPDIIYTLDDKGHFTFVSDAVEHLLGFKAPKLIGKPFTTIIHDEDLEKARYHFDERRTGARANAGIELRLKVAGEEGTGKSSEPRNLTVELKSTGMYDRPVSENGVRFVGTHGVARDISERNRLEAQLQQAKKMEAIGTLAGGIAHDFNNLLMGIQGYTSLMLLGIDASEPHHQKLKNIEGYIQSGVELTKQLLGFARGGKYDVKPINLNELIVKSSQMFGRTKKEITIHRQLETEAWTVEADRGQIEQVLLNLYVNAWQAMPGGGDIYLETENVTVDDSSFGPAGLEPGRYVRASVRDTGVGMDEKTLQRIFEPFFSTKKMGRGSGLGLASAYGIIRNHNGIIEARSQKGVGTTFTIFLPASDRAVEKAAGESGEVLMGPETILLVDDEEMIINVGTEILKALGYNVLSVRGGKEAVELFRNKKEEVDLVLLDMIMPGMGGGETYDALKGIKPDVKILLSSGYSIDGEASEILKRGCDGFIQKPFNIKALSQKLRKIIDGSGVEGRPTESETAHPPSSP
jgi:two-component system cell cycle sensor histidine kinase/response regulator CckA